MASLESLPPDQKAVLSLVLQRGRGYDEIAQLLAIDRAAVRDRALKGFDQLGPSTTVAAPQRALITDYILGQLPPPVAAQVRDRLASNAPERAWARVSAAEPGPIATTQLPEIPAAGAAPARRAQPAAAAPAAPEPVATPAAQPAPVSTAKAAVPAAAAPAAAAPAAAAPSSSAPGGAAPAGDSGPAISRRGGAILLGLLVIVIVAVVVVLIATSGSSKKTPTTQANTTTPSGSTTTNASGTGTSTQATVLKKIALVAANGGKTPTGAAEVAEQNGVKGIVLIGESLPANTNFAYAIWLYNSKTSASKLLGYYNGKVTATGKGKGIMEAEAALPSNATTYNELLVTKETGKATKPGTLVLEGAFSES